MLAIFFSLSFIISAILAFLILYFIRFYSRLKYYPKGPIPIPVLGNILSLRNEKRHPLESMLDLSCKYGSVYTFWMGNNPMVFIHDLELAKRAFTTSSLAGRPQIPTTKLFCNGQGTDVLFADYSKGWRCLRNVTHSAVRKYAVSEKLALLTNDIIDEIVEMMIMKEGIGKAFDPSNYIQLTLYNLISSSAFGEKYTFDDPEFLKLDKISKTIFEFGNKNAVIQFVPILGVLHISKIISMYKIVIEYTKLMYRKYKSHKKTYEAGVIRDFTDALFAAKDEAITLGKESAQHLKDYSIMCSVWDLFFAGIDTTQITFQWMVLFIANYPEVQQKLRQEIDEVIGDRRPSQEDMSHCHYVNAFISEALRFRNVVPFSVPHKTVSDVEIGEHKIRANTIVVIHQHFILNDPKHWSEPEVFKPERFLEDGHYLSQRPQAFIPFSIGQRKCLGERLAMSNLFLMLARFLQSTKDYTISLPEGPGSADLDPNPDTAVQFSYPKSYRIILNACK